MPHNTLLILNTLKPTAHGRFWFLNPNFVFRKRLIFLFKEEDFVLDGNYLIRTQQILLSKFQLGDWYEVLRSFDTNGLKFSL